MNNAPNTNAPAARNGNRGRGRRTGYQQPPRMRQAAPARRNAPRQARRRAAPQAAGGSKVAQETAKQIAQLASSIKAMSEIQVQERKNSSPIEQHKARLNDVKRAASSMCTTKNSKANSAYTAILTPFGHAVDYLMSREDEDDESYTTQGYIIDRHTPAIIISCPKDMHAIFDSLLTKVTLEEGKIKDDVSETPINIAKIRRKLLASATALAEAHNIEAREVSTPLAVSTLLSGPSMARDSGNDNSMVRNQVKLFLDDEVAARHITNQESSAIWDTQPQTVSEAKEAIEHMHNNAQVDHDDDN